MSAELDVDSLLREFPPNFESAPFYSPEGDCIHWYFENVDGHAERIDCWLTVRKAFDDGRLVGFKLKSVRLLLNAFDRLGLEVRISEAEWTIDLRLAVALSPLVLECTTSSSYRDVLSRIPKGQTVHLAPTAA